MKISLKEKLGYSIGEFAGGTLWQAMMFFLPVFYTDTFGLSAAATATLFVVVRIFDALNDPLMGVIADRTNSRWGKFRPFLLWGAIPYGILAVLMFTTPDLNYTGKLVYAYVTYFSVLVFYTFLMVPYNSILGVMTSDPDERTSISGFKFVFAYCASIAVQALVVPMVDKLGGGDDALGYRLTMTGLAVVSSVAILIAFFTSRERVKPNPMVKPKPNDDIRDLFNNRSYIILFSVCIIFLVYIAIRSASVMYYFEYYLERKDLSSIFMVTGTVAVIIGVLPTKWLTTKFEKRNVFIVSTLILGVSLIINFFAAPDNLILIFTTHIIFSLASGPGFPILWTMLADVADYSEWKTGRRATALVYSAATFGQKTGGALGAALMLLVLEGFGYVANQSQSVSSLLGMRLTMTVIPGVIAIAGTVLLLFYTLSNEKMNLVEKELEERRKNQAV